MYLYKVFLHVKVTLKSPQPIFIIFYQLIHLLLANGLYYRVALDELTYVVITMSAISTRTGCYESKSSQLRYRVGRPVGATLECLKLTMAGLARKDFSHQDRPRARWLQGNTSPTFRELAQGRPNLP